VTRPERGGRSRLTCLRRAFLIAAGTIAASFAASAADADLQRALLDSGCIEPRIETVLQQRDLVAYRANCLGTAHKTLIIVCSRGRCDPASSPRDRDR
jgi:hypothetical protein